MFGIIQEVDNTLAVDKGNKTYTTLGYANGPGGLNGSRQDLRNVNTSHKDFLQQATVLTGSETHGSEDVGENLPKLRTKLLEQCLYQHISGSTAYCSLVLKLAILWILMIFLKQSSDYNGSESES